MPGLNLGHPYATKVSANILTRRMLGVQASLNTVSGSVLLPLLPTLQSTIPSPQEDNNGDYEGKMDDVIVEESKEGGGWMMNQN